MVENRRNTESNAFQSDVQTLKKKVADYEKYIKKLKQLVDEEKTAQLIDDLQENHVTDVDLDQLLEEISKIEEEVLDAKRFKMSAQYE